MPVFPVVFSGTRQKTYGHKLFCPYVLLPKNLTQIPQIFGFSHVDTAKRLRALCRPRAVPWLQEHRHIHRDVVNIFDSFQIFGVDKVLIFDSLRVLFAESIERCMGLIAR